MALLKCGVYLGIIGVLCFVLGRFLPKRLFKPDSFPYRSFGFEKEGRFYFRIRINTWQAIVPDMSRMLPQFMMKKRIEKRPNDAAMTAMLRETCVAEFIHVLLSLLGLYVLWIWPGIGGLAVYAVYFLLGNLPFILIQRYNRPRLRMLRAGIRRQFERLNAKKSPTDRRVLILSCNTGEGHNSCARAVQEAFVQRGLTCDIADALAFISPGTSRFMSKGHVRIYRYLPRLFRFGYRFSERHPELFRENSLLHRLLALGSDPIASHIVDGGYDIVISTHVFSALMLTVAQKRHALNIRTGFVATDYTRSPTMERSNLDLYFVPDVSLIRDFTIGPITADRIIDSGIPVRREMYCRTEKQIAREQCGIPVDARHLLVMCGSMGCGPLKWIIALLAMELKENQYITVVCGTNQKLKAKLDKRYGNHPQIRIHGFRNDIPLLMDSADLYLTKPGGLSVTEAAVKNLPMVMINAVAGCEEYNKNFYVKAGFGVTADSIWSLSRLCMDILSDDESLAQLRQAGSRKHWQNAAERICTAMLNGAFPE